MREFVALSCPECGGKIEITEAVFTEDFIQSADGFTYIGSSTGEKVRCVHCGTEFKRRQSVELHFEGKGHLSVNTCGGAFIGGHVNTGGGDFVGRDSKTIIVSNKTRR